MQGAVYSLSLVILTNMCLGNSLKIVTKRSCRVKKNAEPPN